MSEVTTEPRIPPALDLSSCEREPLHLSSAIQPHGALLVADRVDLCVLQASANLERVVGVSAEAMLGKRLGALLGAPVLDQLGDALHSGTLARLNPIAVTVLGNRFDAIVHATGPLLVLELEPTHGDGRAPHELYTVARRALVTLQDAGSLPELWRLAAQELRLCTGFDRVMIYRFERDDHGHVVGEACGEGVEPFLGLHYPASDIPKQARALYLENRIRLIADVGYAPAPILPTTNPLTHAPLDLTHSALRSVSPVHLEYLRNMGVQASMSVSIVVESRLWGLIACHHLTPKYVPFEVRMASELISVFLSTQIHALEAGERAQAAKGSAEISTALVRQMAGADLVTGLVGGPRTVLELIPASGAAVSWRGAITPIGRTPPDAELGALVRWLAEHHGGDLFATDSLAKRYPQAEALRATASGVLAVPIGEHPEDLVIWFRPEVIATVSWGGNPEKPVELTADGARLSPRRSFELWKAEVHHTSEPWPDWGIEAARALRQATLGVVLRRSAELAALNAELRAAVAAREDFLSMASHELRTPLTTLQLQVERLSRSGARAPAEPLGSQRVQDSLRMLHRQGERLERLVSTMLDVASMTAGRLELRREPGVELGALARDIVARLEGLTDQVSVSVQVRGDTTGEWDPLRLEQIVSNLVSNAAKYGQGTPIEVVVSGEPEVVVASVSDRGMGIPAEAHARIFERFERVPTPALHPGGFGLGLWIVKLLVEAHGGTIAVDSGAGRGATFTVRLPRHPGATAETTR